MQITTKNSRLRTSFSYQALFFPCAFLFIIIASSFAQAKSSKQLSSFEYYLKLQQRAHQELKASRPDIDDATASIEPEPINYETISNINTSTEEVVEITKDRAPYIPGNKQFPMMKTKPIGIIAIIIDDIGNQEALDMRAANLPGAVTLAVLPHTPYSKSVAQFAYEQSKDVMLHAPMESKHHRRLGEGALTQNLSKEEFELVLQDSINSIPHVIGVNNHMGSLLTQNDEAMNWVMQVVQKNNLFFVDSRTTPNSVAGQLARQYSIPTLSRHVFLDNEQTQEYVDQAFQKTLKISRKTGFALAIGHPYPSTVSYLEKAIPKLAEQGYQLVPVSYVLTQKMQTASTQELNIHNQEQNTQLEEQNTSTQNQNTRVQNPDNSLAKK